MGEDALGKTASTGGEKTGTGDSPPAPPVFSPEETGGVRLDERGFRRRGELIPWDRVTCVVASGAHVTVEGLREEGGPAHVLFSLRAGPRTSERIAAAWRERVLSGLEGGEPLAGTVRASATWIPRIFLALSLLMIADAVVCAGAAGRVSTVLGLESQEALGIVSPRARLLRTVSVLSLIAAGVAAVCAVVFLLAAVRCRRLLRDWRRWELSVDGLTYWPAGPAGRRERRLLRPFAGDVLAPEAARMNERRVPLRWLSASPLVTPVLLARGARAESDVIRGPWYEFWLMPAVIAVLLVLAFVCQTALSSGVYWTVALVAAGLALAAVWIAHFVSSGRRRRRLLEEGARLLERLGW